MKIVKNNVVLEKTYFYPTSGGQLHDTGLINNCSVIDVFKQGDLIVHVLEKVNFKQGETVNCLIDSERRYQLAKHHTATHIINAAARKILGNHINQAGAKKDVDKAHIDITHYQSLSEEELKNIENEANRLVNEKIPTRLYFMARDEAERRYGMEIYQGGAVPGKQLRIVEILGTDIECCGGTHLKNTYEANPIKILKSHKISDSIVRIEFKAGKAAVSEEKKELTIEKEIAKLLDCEINHITKRAEELFLIWKKIKKAEKTELCLKKEELELKSKEETTSDILTETAKLLNTQPEHIIKTIKRFLDGIKNYKK